MYCHTGQFQKCTHKLVRWFTCHICVPCKIKKVVFNFYCDIEMSLALRSWLS